MKKINVVTLGCSKNTVDSEHLAAQLAAAGYQIVFDSNRTDAKVVVINTCGFIGDAKQESIDTILRFAAAKEQGLIERLFVIGCLSERYADELRAEIPEVDDYFGARDMQGIARVLCAAGDPDTSTERLTSTPKHYAYLKIAEGCNWHCGYCAIPLIRGPHRSVPMERCVEEAERLAAQGVRELIVIAQDTTYYGRDLYGRRALAELLEKLCKVEGIEWIRLHYAYPTDFPQDVIEVMAREKKICPYLDIPFQHISDHQLTLMKRRHTKADAYALIERLRAAVPDLALRTTLLVGYPDETEEDFEATLDVLRRVRYDMVYSFIYSPRSGTPAAQMADQIPEDVKGERLRRLLELQKQIAEEKNAELLGTEQRVLCYGTSKNNDGMLEGRTEGNKIVLFKGDSDLEGKYVNVKITETHPFVMYGEKY